jgi:molecular chaperone GrpE
MGITKEKIEGYKGNKMTKKHKIEKDKIKELESKIEELEESKNSLEDKLLRSYADFDNYKKRLEKNNDIYKKSITKDIVVELLSVMDDFERSIEFHNKNRENLKDCLGIIDGYRLIYNKLSTVLSNIGVTKIDSVNKKFDVDYHDAIMDKTTQKDKYVIDEVQSGYMLNDEVIRHSKVIVGDKPNEQR